MNEEYEKAKTRPMSREDVLTYLNMLERKSIHYRAELIIKPGDENALHNLKLLDRYAVKDMSKLTPSVASSERRDI